jgi:hypothetical protein
MTLIPKQKTCTMCHKIKLVSQFYRNRCKKDGLNYECKECFSKYSQSKHYKRNQRKWKQSKHGKIVEFASYIKCRYGITLAEYNILLESQGGVCKICRRKSPQGKRLSVDHDHNTGRVRGLLCNPCNLVLGNANESVLTLQAAILYLREQACP